MLCLFLLLVSPFINFLRRVPGVMVWADVWLGPFDWLHVIPTLNVHRLARWSLTAAGSSRSRALFTLRVCPLVFVSLCSAFTYRRVRSDLRDVLPPLQLFSLHIWGHISRIKSWSVHQMCQQQPWEMSLSVVLLEDKKAKKTPKNKNTLLLNKTKCWVWKILLSCCLYYWAG